MRPVGMLAPPVLEAVREGEALAALPVPLVMDADALEDTADVAVLNVAEELGLPVVRKTPVLDPEAPATPRVELPVAPG